MVGACATVLGVNVVGFGAVFSGEVVGSLVHRFLTGFVPGSPRAQRFDFRELTTGRSMFGRKSDVEIRDEALASSGVVEIGVGGESGRRNEWAEEAKRFCISNDPALID